MELLWKICAVVWSKGDKSGSLKSGSFADRFIIAKTPVLANRLSVLFAKRLRIIQWLLLGINIFGKGKFNNSINTSQIDKNSSIMAFALIYS